jgi:hypothetical protein
VTGADRAGVVTIVLASLFAFVVGVAVGFITTFTHRGLPPLGLLAGLAIITAAVLGFRLVFASRVIGAAAALGAVGSTALLTMPGAGGTVFVIDDAIGWAWAIAPTVLALLALAWPLSPPRRRAVAHRSKMES